MHLLTGMAVEVVEKIVFRKLLWAPPAEVHDDSGEVWVTAGLDDGVAAVVVEATVERRPPAPVAEAAGGL